MSWRIAWTRPAERDLRRLDRSVAERVRQAIRHFATTDEGDVRRLRGYEGEWRLRIGDWRVRFERDEDTRTIIILRVLPRGRVYRD